ncbi:DUF4870 domain-containing protein, partial [Patescibacteria group bacterium]
MTENKVKVSKYTNLEPNVAASLAYLVTPITGIAFFILEKEDKFVRFHAFQSILFGFSLYAAWFIATSLVFVFIGALLIPLVSIGGLAIYLMLLWKAYNNEMYELPYLGKVAK